MININTKEANKNVKNSVLDPLLDSMGEESPESNYPSHQYEEEPYFAEDLSSAIPADPGYLYHGEYLPVLEKGISKIIEIEGPIEYELIVKRVKTAHNFRKAGSSIRAIIDQAIPRDVLKTKFGNRTFYWPKNSKPEAWNKARRFRSDFIETQRTVFEISPEEINAIRQIIIRRSESKLYASQQVKKITEFLGYKKCTKKAITYILEAFQHIDGLNG